MQNNEFYAGQKVRLISEMGVPGYSAINRIDYGRKEINRLLETVLTLDQRNSPNSWNVIESYFILNEQYLIPAENEKETQMSFDEFKEILYE